MSNDPAKSALRTSRLLRPVRWLLPLLPKWGPFGALRYGMTQLEGGKLAVGDAAPDAVLVELDGTEHALLERVQGKPLVLVFGSFT